MRRNIVGFQQGLQALVLQGLSSRRQHGWVVIVIVKTSGNRLADYDEGGNSKHDGEKIGRPGQKAGNDLPGAVCCSKVADFLLFSVLIF